jgi:hypothetical protein
MYGGRNEVFNRLRIGIKSLSKKLFSPRDAQPKFINPYAMTEATTHQYYVQPKFINGKFILEKEEPSQRTSQGADTKKESIRSHKRSDNGFAKSLVEVVISDIEGIAGERKKKTEKSMQDKERYDHFLELAGGKK